MYRVMIADDELIERMLISKIIKRNFREQLEIVEAVNGREAIELFEQQNCQIILMDIEMPGINGLEAAETIRGSKKECSIIFLTAFDEFNYAKKAISVKALDYLLKPCEEEELVSALWEAIRFAQKEHKREQDASLFSKREEKSAEADNLKKSAVAGNISDYIRMHYKEDITLQAVAAAMNYSEVYFCKLFKQYFGKSFVAYMTDFRVERAKKLLADVSVNIKDIGIEVGYNDSNYFAKVFKRITGITPSEYRLQILQQKSGMVR